MDLFDLIGPVMVGPSSSHTAGAARIGQTARLLLGEEVVAADVGLHGSFAKTYHGHGTDRAIAAGLMGMAVDDTRMRHSLELAEERGIRIAFHPTQIRDAHPNTVRLSLYGEDGRTLTMEAASVGGGSIRVTKLDGMNVDFSGKENTLIIHHRDTPGEIAHVTGLLAEENMNIGAMQVYRRGTGGDALMVIELDGKPSAKVIAAIERTEGVSDVSFLERRDG